MLIYKITSKISGRVYIGQTVSTLKRRISGHKSHARRFVRKIYDDKMYITKAIAKYGWENFAIEEIFRCKNVDELNLMEKFWIAIYNADNVAVGYNLTSGGVGYKHSKESKLQISKSLKGRKFSEEHKKLIGSRVGFKYSVESKKKISNSLKGRLPNSGSFKKGQSSRAKITFEIAEKIRKEYKDTKISYEKLGIKYELTKHGIYNIINYRTWKPEEHRVI